MRDGRDPPEARRPAAPPTFLDGAEHQTMRAAPWRVRRPRPVIDLVRVAVEIAVLVWVIAGVTGIAIWVWLCVLPAFARALDTLSAALTGPFA